MNLDFSHQFNEAKIPSRRNESIVRLSEWREKLRYVLLGSSIWQVTDEQLTTVGKLSFSFAGPAIFCVGISFTVAEWRFCWGWGATTTTTTTATTTTTVSTGFPVAFVLS
jgi:hypothetical protein